MELLQDKAVSYDDDVNMTMSVIKDDERFKAAGDRARHWLMHYFAFQRQVCLHTPPASDILRPLIGYSAP